MTVQPTCFGCDVSLPDEPGLYYCDACVAKQEREIGGSEREAFDRYHVFADACARVSR